MHTLEIRFQFYSVLSKPNENNRNYFIFIFLNQHLSLIINTTHKFGERINRKDSNESDFNLILIQSCEVKLT